MRFMLSIMHWTILKTILILTIHYADCRDCYDEFTVTNIDGDAVDLKKQGATANSTTVFNDDVQELTVAGTILYYIEWKDDLMEDPFLDTGDSSYLGFSIDDTEDKTLTVITVDDIEGLPDYNNADPMEQLDMTIVFSLSEDQQCLLHMQLVIVDDNTQKPKFKSGQTFEIEVIETYPTDYPISSTFLAVDYDAKSPNNVFEVLVDEGCPLAPDEDQYLSIEGSDAEVSFHLTNQLDYEKLKNISCTITLMDHGDEPLTSSKKFLIIVLPADDEGPKLTSTSYTGVLISTTTESEVITDPGPILAIDQDDPESKDVFYYINIGDPIESLDYFGIDENSGVVSVIQDLDNDFLLNILVTFVIETSDTNDNMGTSAILTVYLPTPVISINEKIEFL